MLYSAALEGVTNDGPWAQWAFTAGRFAAAAAARPSPQRPGLVSPAERPRPAASLEANAEHHEEPNSLSPSNEQLQLLMSKADLEACWVLE